MLANPPTDRGLANDFDARHRTPTRGAGELAAGLDSMTHITRGGSRVSLDTTETLPPAVPAVSDTSGTRPVTGVAQCDWPEKLRC